jgi:hypothetical protein
LEFEISASHPADAARGALRGTDYISKLKAAGFQTVEIEPTRVYTADDFRVSSSAAKGLTPIQQLHRWTAGL